MPKRLSLLLLIAVAQVWAAYPGDAFLPNPSYSDSFSLRVTPNDPYSTVKGHVYRRDVFVRAKDGLGRPTRIDIVVPNDTVVDSTVARYDWSLDIPSVDPYPFPSRTAAKMVEETFLRGVAQGSDTTWSAWDPLHRILVRTQSNPDSGCRWRDSSVFDAQNRLVSQWECSESSSGSQSFPETFIYRAWFAHQTDSLPTSESEVNSVLQGQVGLDTLFVTGNPNRPDSLFWGGGSRVEILLRDGSGYVVKTIEYTISTPASKDSAIYTYDAVGRLIGVFQPSLPDTALFLYSWNNQSDLYQIHSTARGIRLVGNDLVLDLPAPDRVQVEVVGLDGKRHGSPLDIRVPAGQSILPIDARLGEIIRVRTSEGSAAILTPTVR